MKLSSKQELPRKYPEIEKKEYKNVWVDWRIYEVDPEHLIPYGKYVNKPLSWVMGNDDSYYEWLAKNNLFGSWGLIRQKKPPKHITAEGEWLSIYEIPGTGIESPFL